MKRLESIEPFVSALKNSIVLSPQEMAVSWTAKVARSKLILTLLSSIMKCSVRSSKGSGSYMTRGMLSHGLAIVISKVNVALEVYTFAVISKV